MLFFAACGKKERELSPDEIRAKADSMVQLKMEKLRREAKDDLDKRLPIELKPRIDSLLNTGSLEQPVPVFPEDEDGETPAAPPDTGAAAKPAGGGQEK